MSWGAAIAAAGQLIGGINANRRMYDFATNAVRIRRDDMVRAGINPILAAGQPATTPNQMNPAAGLAQTGVSNYSARQTAKLQREQARLTKANAVSQEFDNILKEPLVDAAKNPSVVTEPFNKAIGEITFAPSSARRNKYLAEKESARRDATQRLLEADLEHYGPKMGPAINRQRTVIERHSKSPKQLQRLADKVNIEHYTPKKGRSIRRQVIERRSKSPSDLMHQALPKRRPGAEREINMPPYPRRKKGESDRLFNARQRAWKLLKKERARRR